MPAIEPPATAASMSRPVLVWDEQLELLIHALAQLPDVVTLEAEAPSAELRPLRLLAGAYGIDDRVTFHEVAEDRRRGILSRPGPLPRGRVIGPGATMAEVVEGLSGPDDPPATLRPLDVVLANQRVALVTNLPAHYRIPLFYEMSRRLTAAGAWLRVFFLAPDDGSRRWLSSNPEGAFDYEFLPSVELPLRARRPHLPLSLELRLAAFRPTMVLTGGLSPLVAARAVRYSRRRGVPCGIWSGETPRASTAQSTFRRVQRIRLLRQVGFGVAYGSAAAGYLHDLRPDLPLVLGRNTSPTRLAQRRSPVRGRVEILCVGDLASPRKGVDIAIEAVRLCPTLRCRLSIVGSGRLVRPLLERAAGDPRIRFLGALPPASVASSYAKADVVLFPTRFDVFGLVLVEAMASGAATVVSGAAGAVDDLAVDGQNCLVVSSHEPRDWAEALTRVIEDGDLRRSLGDNARRTIERRWTIEHAADAMVAGLRLAVLQAQDGTARA